LTHETHINSSVNQNPNTPGKHRRDTKNASGEVHKCECIIVWDFNHSHDNIKV